MTLKFYDKLNMAAEGKPAIDDPMPGMTFQSEAAGDMWDPSLSPLNQATRVDGVAETYMRDVYFPTKLFKGGSSANGPTQQILLDVEHYGWGNRSTADAATVADSKTQFLKIIAIWRDVRPDLDIGIWNMSPWPNRSWAIGTAEQQADWREDQDDLQDVYDLVDTLYATLYAPNPSTPWTRAQQKEYMETALLEARRLGPTKRIVAYIRPFHLPDAPIVQHEYFREILDTIKTAHDAGNCDGIVFWNFHDATQTWQALIDGGIIDVIKRFTSDWR